MSNSINKSKPISDINNDIGIHIHRIRKDFKYTQKKLVTALNEFYLKDNIVFTQAEISYIESGKQETKKILYIIKYFFDVHDIKPEYFFIKKLNENKVKLNTNLTKLFDDYNKALIALNKKLQNDISKLFYK